MNLSDALSVIAAEATMPEHVNADSLKKLRKGISLPSGVKAVEAVGLKGNISIRPIEALHALSYATRPLYQDDMYDAYMLWGVLRYLGFFDHSWGEEKSPGLRVSDVGSRVQGVQRGVASEDLGIGFGVYLAGRWFRELTKVNVPLNFIDVDLIYPKRSRRSDYLIIAPDPQRSGHYATRFLECKGTGSADYTKKQIKDGVAQLGNKSGLVVSTLANELSVSYFAVQLDGDGQPPYAEDATVLDRPYEFWGNIKDGRHGVTFKKALEACWARLANFGGNLAALGHWSPQELERSPSSGRREQIETPFGPARGTTSTIVLAGNLLQATFALECTVDDALTDGDNAAIVAAQSKFATRAAAGTSAGDIAEEAIYSAMPNGSILSLGDA